MCARVKERNRNDLNGAIMITEIILAEARWSKAGTRYCVTLHDGEILIASARDPEHEAARELLNRGITGDLITRWSGSSTIAMRLDIETAAKSRIVEGARTPPLLAVWRPGSEFLREKKACQPVQPDCAQTIQTGTTG